MSQLPAEAWTEVAKLGTVFLLLVTFIAAILAGKVRLPRELKAAEERIAELLKINERLTTVVSENSKTTSDLAGELRNAVEGFERAMEERKFLEVELARTRQDLASIDQRRRK